MFYRLFHYGIRDIFRNFKRIVLFNIIILFISIPILSSIDSVIFGINNEIQNKSDKDIVLELVPISFDDINKELKSNLFDYFGKYNYTFFISRYFSEKYQQKISIFDNRSDSKYNKAYLFAGYPIDDISLKSINNKFINEKISKITTIPEKDISSAYYIYEIINKDELIKSYDSLDKSEILNILDTVGTSDKDSLLILQNIFDNSFANLKIIESKEVDEIGFIFKYIFVFNGLNIILLNYALYYFYHELFTKLRKEYLIHYIHGATIKDIFYRTALLNMIIILNNFIILNVLNAFKINPRFYIILAMSFGYTIIFFVNNLLFLRKIKNSILYWGKND